MFKLFKKKKRVSSTGKFVVLLILDGFGLYPIKEGNAIRLAKTPNLDKLWTYAPHTTLLASEEAVGLEKGYTGNSEVGHLNMGAGTLILQSLTRINDAIAQNKLQKNKILLESIKWVKKHNSSYHLMGVLSPAGVHAHIRHLYALLEILEKHNINPYLHLFLDGRDTGIQDGFFFLTRLKRKLKQLQIGTIASISGRFFAMDRNTRWERTEKAYNAILGIDGRKATDVFAIIQKAYHDKENDEYFIPTIMVDNNEKPIGPIKDNDAVLFFNFREDRARQITQAFVKPEFKGFDRIKTLHNIYFATMVGYSEGLQTHTLFPPVNIEHTVSSVLAKHNIPQLHIAETEKYAHVTYFFNGGREKPHNGEKFFMIPSPLVKDYAETPNMSVPMVAQEVINQIKLQRYKFYLINFANPDMLGHTGNLDATVQAIETTDKHVGQIAKITLKLGGTIIITADHGNCEEMIELRTGIPLKYHTLNPVPFIVAFEHAHFPEDIQNIKVFKIGDNITTQPAGILADIGTTVLHLFGIQPPSSMTGINLLDAI